MRVFVMLFLLAGFTRAQWKMQESHSTADLRGIHSLGGSVAWASGSHGTVLRTEDGGKTWMTCAVPEGGEKLDFRGVQAFDAKTAIVMSSGTGDLSRLYKTADGCKTWKLVFTNPDKDGFFDAVQASWRQGLLIGDPVEDRFAIFASTDGDLEKWHRLGEQSSLNQFRFDFEPYKGESLFAASNSVMRGSSDGNIAFVSGGDRGALFFRAIWQANGAAGHPTMWTFVSRIPVAVGSSAGAFSIAGDGDPMSHGKWRLVAVGGDYQKPSAEDGTAAYSKDGGQHWQVANLCLMDIAPLLLTTPQLKPGSRWGRLEQMSPPMTAAPGVH